MSEEMGPIHEVKQKNNFKIYMCDWLERSQLSIS